MVNRAHVQRNRSNFYRSLPIDHDKKVDSKKNGTSKWPSIPKYVKKHKLSLESLSEDTLKRLNLHHYPKNPSDSVDSPRVNGFISMIKQSLVDLPPEHAANPQKYILELHYDFQESLAAWFVSSWAEQCMSQCQV